MSAGKGAKIQVWIDCQSFYSRFALQHLRRYAKQLAEHGVEYEAHPVFINGINVASKNQPPWMNAAKAAYSVYDGDRAAKYFGNNRMTPPKSFPMKTLPALRSMCYIKATYPKEKYEVAFLELCKSIWEDHFDLGQPELLTQVLRRHFSDEEVTTILEAAQDAKWKDQLSQNTQAAVEKGAFGAPWFWVRNARGQEEPFFGSDRFHFMWAYLDIPHRDFEVLSGQASARL